ncbi:MAG TPA: amino acid carrier protein [Pirellulales bacterium]
MIKRMQARLAFYLVAGLVAITLAGTLRHSPASGQELPAATEAATSEASSANPVSSAAATGEAIAEEGRAVVTKLPPPPADPAWVKPIDDLFGAVLVKPLETILFFNLGRAAVWFGTPESEIPTVPLVVAWLVAGALFFTVRMRFVNLWAFGHAVALTRGDYDDPADKGEVSHFQALSSALSATVGLGNIAGVATAVSLGGPGAVFWMTVVGFLGMTSKFTECTLGVLYREISPEGRVSGGPMHYLKTGLAEIGWGKVGTVLSLFFAVMCIGASFGGGCAYQVNQSLRAIETVVPVLSEYRWAYGLLMVVAVGVVIVGGIKQIAATAEKIVPLMTAVYVVCTLTILAAHADRIVPAFQTILVEAFTPAAGLGGVIGVMFMGARRAAFSNEAGVGSASIAHSAAKTDEPVSEGIVALLEPFIDTIVICNMTGLLIVVTGVYADPAFAHLNGAEKGALLTVNAFGTVSPWFPYLLAVAVFMFAYSTAISWSYYGERCWSFLFGERASLVYKLLFLTFAFLGSIVTAQNALDFSDLMILAMAFPNVFGAFLLSGRVYAELQAYWARLQTHSLRGGRHK